MAEAPAGEAGGAAGAKQDPQALIAKHAVVTQAGAQGDQAIVARVENAIKNSPMGWLQGVLGETSSRASSEQSQVSGKLAEHKDLVANQKDVPKDAGPPPAPGPAAHPAVPHPAAPAKAAVAAPAPAAGGAPEHHAPIAGAAVPKSAPASAPAAAPAPTVASAVAGAGDSQIDGILNGYTPKGAQSTQTLGRIKSMGDIAQGFNGQLDTYIAQGGAVESGIASTANFLGAGKDVSAVWANNPYRKVHGILGGIMTGMSAVKNVCGVVGSICGKLGMVLTVIGLLGMIFPPIGAAVSGIARILNVVGLICDSISFVLSGILTGLNGVVLAQQIAAGASAEEKAATADLMMSEANEAASGFVNLAMVFGPKFMKGLLGNSKGIVASLIKRAKATIGRVSLKLSANVSHFANKIVRKLGFGGASFERVGGAWKDTGFLASTKAKWAGSKIGAAFNGAPKHLEGVQERLMAKYGNTAWAKNMDRVGAWGGSVAHRLEKFDLGEQAGRLGEKSGSAMGGAFAETKIGKSMATAAERSELQTRELTMKMEARDAAHLEESRWKNQLDRRQAANPDHVREAGAEQKFVAGQGQKVRDDKMAEFQSQERQREAKERLEQRRTDRFERRHDEFYENKTNGITGVGARDEMMAGVHNTRERRYALEAEFKPQETERKELLAKTTKTAAEQERLTALNGELRKLDEARRVNKMYETDLSGLASGAERVRAPEYNNWKDVGSNGWEATAPALEMVHLKDQDSAWALAEKADLKKQTKYNKGTAQANAAGRGGHGTFADIAGDARHRELDEMTEFVRAAPQTRTVTSSVRGMLSPIIDRGAPAAAVPAAATAMGPQVSPTPTPTPVGPGPAHAPGGVTVSPTEHKEGDPVGASMQVAAQVHEPPVTAAAPAHDEKKEEPAADEAGGEALPYWPALIPEFDKATHDFGWMRKVAVEFKKAQIDGKQKAVDTLAVYGRYKEYAAARAAAAQKNTASAAQTGQATQQNVGHAAQTEGQAGQGEQKQGEAKGAANDKAATELPEPESRGFWGRILGAVKRWAKNKAAQVFGWIQEKIASVILKGLCGVSMGDMREYAGALRRQQQAAHGVADGAGKTSGQAQQTSIKLSSDATKEAQGAADAIGECDKNIVDADQFMADIGSFEQQLAEEKANAQMFIASVHAAAEAERTKQQTEAAAHAAEEKKEQERAAQLGGGSGAPAAAPASAPVQAAAPAPVAGEPAHEPAAPEGSEQDVSQIHAASQYVATESESMTGKLEARADDYTNQLALALTNRTGKGADGVDLKGPAKKESKHIVEEFKAAAQHTKIDMEAFHNMSIDPSQSKRIAEQIITSAQHLEETYNHSENALDELFARTYNGIKDGRRTLKSRMLDGDNAIGAANHAGDAVDNKAIDTALPTMNTAWDTVAKPIQAPAAAPAPVMMASNDAAPVQRKATGEAAGGGDPNAIATAGVQSANERMPHHDQIQASFGRHDVSGIRAQTGGGAAEASRGLGASAYAVGNRVGFAQSPDLHTAAHEAAHVVQQQAGVQLKGGIDGGNDDPHEQHADAVADKVVRGESAEGLLDTMGPTKSGAAASPAPVQRKGKVPTASELRKQLHEYLVPNSNVVWREFHPYITSTMFAQPNPRLHWGNDRAFNELLFRQLSQYIDVGNIAQLDELLYPSNAVNALGGLIPGTTDWSVEFGLALFHELHISISGSIQRMGERLVAYADSTGISGEVEINTNDLVTSVPMDRYVGPALCFRGTVVVSELPAKAAKAAKGKPTGLRAVHVTWQSGELWNWVKADPADATAEEVAATLFRVTDNHGDYMASFNAYMLAAAPPLFGVPKRFAIQNKNAKAPPNALAGDDSVNRQLMTLASGSAADESALHEDAPGKQPTDPKAAGAPVLGAEYKAVSDAITDLLLQLRFAEKQATPWGFATLVAPAIKFLMHKDGELKHADPARLADWLQLFQNQKDRVSRIAGGINDLVGSAKKLGITDPKAPQAGPAREIFEQFAMAAGLSHLAQPSEAKLAEGLRLQSTLAVRALQSTEGDMMGAIQEANQRTGGDDKFMRQMSHEAGDLQDRSRMLQMQMVNGKEVDQNDYDDVALKSEEVALLSRLQGLRVELAHLNNAADAAGKGDAAIIASLFSGKFRNLKHLSAHIFGELQPIYSHIRSLHDDYAKNEKAGIYNDPKYKAQERAQRRVELANAKQKFQDVSADPDVVDFFQTAAATIQNQQFRTAIVQTAAMIGISIVAGAVAGLAARAVGGVLLEAAGVEAVTDLGVVARTGIGAAKVATQIGVDTTINSAGAAAIQGRDFTEVWKENLIVGLASTALFGSISRYGQAVAQREAEIASLEGRVIEAPVAVTWAKATAGQRTVMALKETGAISAHTLWGIAVGEVAGRIVTGKTSPPPETLRDWALQGISVAVGRHVQERVISHSEMYKALEVRAEDGGRALTATAKNLTAMAQEVITSKNAKRAAELLAEHDEFLRKEIAEIDKAIAKHGDHNGELFEARRNLELAAAAAGDDGMLGTKMTLLGMEELVPGALWKGTKDQIEHALATQKNPPPKVTHEGARWRVQLGERVIEIQEVASAQKTVDVERVVLAGSDEEVRLAAKIVPPEPGMLDVVVHGSIDDFMVTVNGRDISIDQRAMAKFIEKSGMKYERIRLLSCKAGMHPKGVAQQLANKLGVPVLAPTEKLYIHPDGKMTVGPSETRDLGSAGWQEFKPQKSSFRYEKAPETPIETTKQAPKEKAPVDVEEREPSATAEKGRAKELGRVPKPPRSGPADASEVDHAEKGDFTDGGKLQGGGHGHGNVAELKARGYEELPAAEVMRLRAQQEPYETKYREWKAQDEAESTWKNARDEFRKGLGDAKELGKLRNPKLGFEEKTRLEALKKVRDDQVAAWETAHPAPPVAGPEPDPAAFGLNPKELLSKRKYFYREPLSNGAEIGGVSSKSRIHGDGHTWFPPGWRAEPLMSLLEAGGDGITVAPMQAQDGTVTAMRHTAWIKRGVKGGYEVAPSSLADPKSNGYLKTSMIVPADGAGRTVYPDMNQVM